MCRQDAGYRRWISMCVHLYSLELQIRKAFSTAQETFSWVICGTPPPPMFPLELFNPSAMCPALVTLVVAHK